MKKKILLLFMFLIVVVGCNNNITTTMLSSTKLTTTMLSSTTQTTTTTIDNSIKVKYIYEDNIIEEIKYYDDTFKEIDHIIKDKYFKGYYLDENFTQKIDVENYKITENQNIYLKYDDYKNYNIVYIPLDNRPVNKERMMLLSKSLNINLIMPEEDLYRTYLDNQLLNKNNTQIGDPKKLLSFIKTLNKDEIDGYIISLDQMTSGGLVGSRANYDSDITDEIKIIEDLVEFIDDKPLYLIDTVMRLASTSGFAGYTTTEYNNLRKYGMAERKKLNNDELTLDNIKTNYNISNKGTNLNISTYGLTQTMYENYINARFRKISLTDKILSLINKENTYYICGIDDSSSTFNIQKNEINYIEKIFPNVFLFPGTDELGLMCLSRVYQDLTNIKNLKAKVTPVGINYLQIDQNYDGTTLKSNVENHLKALNVEINNKNYDFEVLVLTQESNSSSLEKYSAKLVEKMQTNFEKNILTCIIDANSISTTQRKILPKYLLDNNSLSLLVGYSSWNTVGNAIGLSLSQASARVSYLKSDYSLNENNTTTTKHFIESLSFGLIKDIVYKAHVGSQISTYINNNAKTSTGNKVSASGNFYQYIPYSPDFTIKLKELMENNKECNITTIKNNIIAKEVYLSTRKEIIKKEISNILISNYRYPWYRQFEICFDITVTLN